MRSEDIDQLMGMIDRAQPYEMRKDNMFDVHAKIYSTIRIMYQHFKKSHQLQIMQAQIHDLPIQQYHIQKHKGTPITAALLFSYHQLEQRDILRMIDIKDELRNQNYAELNQQILKAIDRQQSVGQCLKCYRTLLNKEFSKSQRGLPNTYEIIQSKMIDKLLRFKKFVKKQTKLITRHISCLPKISRPILTLISRLYSKVAAYKDFDNLYMIFEKNQPENKMKQDYEAIFRICRPETLQKVREYLSTDISQNSVIIQGAQKQAKEKLLNMEPQFNAKTIHILNFIVEVIKKDIHIWPQIIQWEHRALQRSKNQLKRMIQLILVQMIRQPDNIETVAPIAQKLIQIDQHSQIGLIVMRQLMKEENQAYLNHRVIRQFLAIKILKYNSSQNYLRQIFHKNLIFTDVLIQMFEYKANALNFYLNIQSNVEDFRIYNEFMAELSARKPHKLKSFFIKAVQVDSDKSDLFSIKSKMLSFMIDRLSLELASGIIRQLCMIPPTRNFLTILTKMMMKFESKQNYSVFKASVARSLNIMLTKIPASQINLHFQIQFPGFLKQYLMKQTNDIFNEVSNETKDQLKKNFQLSHKRFM